MTNSAVPPPGPPSRPPTGASPMYHDERPLFHEPIHELPEPLPRRKNTWRVWVLVAIAAVVGIGSVLFVAFQAPDEFPMTEAERDVVVTVDDIAEFIDVGVEVVEETAIRYVYFDDSYELVYSYEDEEIFIGSSLSVAASTSDARIEYLTLTVGMDYGEGIEAEDRGSMLRWGDSSKCVLLVGPEGPVGNYFVARKGKKIVHVHLVGVYFDEREPFRELMMPILKRVNVHAR